MYCEIAAVCSSRRLRKATKKEIKPSGCWKQPTAVTNPLLDALFHTVARKNSRAIVIRTLTAPWAPAETPAANTTSGK